MTKYLPWHKNTAVQVEGMTTSDILEATGLDWSVNLAPVQFEFNGAIQTVDNLAIAHRSDTGQVFGTYDRRDAWQNADVIEAYHEFCSTTGLTFDYAGALPDGLYCASHLAHKDIAEGLPTSVGDLFDFYLVMKESHRPGKAMQVILYANRLVCTNGQAQRIRVKGKTLAHVHEFDKGQIWATLEAAQNTVTEQVKVAKELAQITMTDAEAFAHLVKLDGGDPSLPLEQQSNLVKTVFKLYKGQGLGSEMITAYNTAYGLFHGLTQYQTSGSRVRGGNAQHLNSLMTGTRANQADKFQRQLLSVG